MRRVQTEVGVRLARAALLVALCLSSGVLAILPTQPPAFGNARATLPQPVLAYTFRQYDCANGNSFTADVGSMNIVRNDTATVCPSLQANSITWNNALPGLQILDAVNRNAVKTTTVNGPFTNITNITIELWFSVSAMSLSSQAIVFEVGGDTGTTNTLSSAQDSYQFRLSLVNSASTIFNNFKIDYQRRTPSGVISNSVTLFSFVGTSIIGKVIQMFVTIALQQSGDFDDVILDWKLQEETSFKDARSKVTATAAREVSFNSLSVLRILSTRAPGSSLSGVNGVVYFVAVYNQTLSQTQMTDAANGGLPNSSPVVRGLVVKAYEDLSSGISISIPNVTTFHAYNRPITGITIKNLPVNGHLLYNGTTVTNGEFTFYNATLLNYIAKPNGFSSWDGSCDEVYDSFTFVATDGLCDTNQASDVNCNSPVEAITGICVEEQNDPPIVQSTATFELPADTDTASAFYIRCKDDDFNTTRFGLSVVRLTSQTNSVAGKVVTRTNGDGSCSGGTVQSSLSSTKPTIDVSSTPNGTYAEVKFCYRASSFLSGLSSDSISFECEDKAGAKTSGSVQIQLRNVLNAGCGSSTSCNGTGAAGGQQISMILNGSSSAASHTNNNRLFQIITLPNAGSLFYGSETAPLSIGRLLPADLVTGAVTIRYQSPSNTFYTHLCGNGVPATQAALCGQQGLSHLTQQNVFGEAVKACSVNNPCDVSFTFQMAYNNSGSISFSPTATARVFVLAVDTGPGTLDGPSLVTADPRAGAKSLLVDYSGNQFIYYPTDGDNFRIGFSVSIEITNADATNLLCFADVTSSIFEEIDFFNDRPLQGCGFRRVSGKAYPRHFNQLITTLQVFRATGFNITTGVGKIAIKVRVFDPIDLPYSDVSFDPDNNNLVSTSIENVYIDWDGYIAQAPSNAFLYTLVSIILGLFFLFLIILALIVWWVSIQPEPVPIEEDPNDKRVDDEFDIQADLDTLDEDHIDGVAGQTSLKRRTVKRDVSGEPVDLTILEWEKLYDEQYEKPYFVNRRTGATTWYPPIPSLMHKIVHHSVATVVPSSLPTREESK